MVNFMISCIAYERAGGREQTQGLAHKWFNSQEQTQYSKFLIQKEHDKLQLVTSHLIAVIQQSIHSRREREIIDGKM